MQRLKQPVSPVMRARITYDGKERTVESRVGAEFFEQILRMCYDLGLDVPSILTCDSCFTPVRGSEWSRHKLEECQALSDTSTSEDRA